MTRDQVYALVRRSLDEAASILTDRVVAQLAAAADAAPPAAPPAASPLRIALAAPDISIRGEVVWQPHSDQKFFLEAPGRIALLAGPMGAGLSTALRMSLLLRAALERPFYGALLTRDAGQHLAHRIELLRLAPLFGGRPDPQPHTPAVVRFPNGNRLTIKLTETAADLAFLQGCRWSAVAIDHVQQFDEVEFVSATHTRSGPSGCASIYATLPLGPPRARWIDARWGLGSHGPALDAAYVARLVRVDRDARADASRPFPPLEDAVS